MKRISVKELENNLDYYLEQSNVEDIIIYDDNQEEVFIGRDLAHQKGYSEHTAAIIDEEVHSIVDSCYKRAESILRENENVLHSCADLLIEKEKITREEFEALF